MSKLKQSIANYDSLVPSGWIENLGVVPLFLFSAFLLEPCLVLLALLLFFVTRVFETMVKLPNSYLLHIYNLRFLPIAPSKVKIFMILPLFFPVFANAVAAPIQDSNNLLISRGQIKEFDVSKMSRFLVANKNILKSKHNKKEKTLWVKGKELGHSELRIWYKNGTKSIFHFYVLPKKRLETTIQISQNLKGLGINNRVSNTLVIVEGQIKDLRQYQFVKSIKNKFPEKVIIKSTLSKKLKNMILGEIYYYFFKENSHSLDCQINSLLITCQFPRESHPTKEIVDFLTNNYFVHFISLKHTRPKKNYIVKLKLIQIEKTNGEELGFGLDKLSGSLGDFFTKGVLGLISENQILLNTKKVHLSTLAEPEAIVSTGDKATFQVGSEIPYHTKGRGGQTTQWKFAGLKIDLQLELEQNRIKLSYESEFTRPTKEKSISGNKEKSVLYIPLGQPTQLFQIGFKTFSKSTSQLPIIEHIPILNQIFKSRSKSSTFKKISGLVIIKEQNNKLAKF
jgi:Flp pilus assembly secretin CpaC